MASQQTWLTAKLQIKFRQLPHQVEKATMTTPANQFYRQAAEVREHPMKVNKYFGSASKTVLS